MITYRFIYDLEDLVNLTPLFIEGYAAMNRKKKVFEVDQEGFIKTLIGVLNTTHENAILVAFDEETPIGYAVGFNDTPAFATSKELLMWALYVKPQYRGDVVVGLFQTGVEFARKKGYSAMKAFNARFTGSVFRLFENKLGMRRHRIQFIYTL